MDKQRIVWIVVLLLLIAIAMMALPRNAGAEDGYPDGVVVFEVGDHTCVLSDAGIECFCPCDGCSSEQPVSPNGEKPVKTEKPTDTPEPPSPTPEKVKCNAGRGNGSEGDPDCDPGNSVKNHGGD